MTSLRNWYILILVTGFGFAGCRFFKPKKSSDQGPGGSSFSHGALGDMPESFYKPAAASGPEPQGLCNEGLVKSTPAGLPEVRLSDAYLNNCSGCHGTAGEGHGSFPKIRGASKDRIASIVRKGGSRMPPFSPELLNEEDLTQIMAQLSSETSLAPFDTQVATGGPFVPVSDDQYIDTMRQGLLEWRRPGERGACMSCHSPDGIDLARINYPNSAIMRRALGQGLPGESAAKIVKMITAQRSRYQISSPCLPSTFIPLQPGNDVLDGGSAEQKDAALLKALAAADVQLNPSNPSAVDLNGWVEKIANLNVHTVSLAIPLNRWTEDSFHGADHASQAKWIPEIPFEASDDNIEALWIRRQNAYLKDPSDENLWILLDAVTSLTGARFTTEGVSMRLAKERYKSVLQLQHSMRFNRRAMPDLTATANLDRFSVWEAAQIASVMSRGCSDSGSDANPFPCWKYPGSFYEKMGTDKERLLKDVLKINLPWLLSGWLVDPALQLTEGGDAQMAHVHTAFEAYAEKFSEKNLYNRLPLHEVYVSLVRLIKSVESVDERLPIGPGLTGKATKSCWTNAGPGLVQWTEATLPAVERMLDPARPQPVSTTHKDMVLAAIGITNKSVLTKVVQRYKAPIAACAASAESLSKVKDLAKLMSDWQGKYGINDAQFSKIVADVESLGN